MTDAPPSPSVRNARWLVVSKASVKLGDLLCDAKTTVPWLLLSAGAPAGMLGLLVPVRESLSMLPQVFIAPWVQAVEPRQRMAAAAIGVQAMAALAIALLAFSLRGAAAGVAVLIALGVLGIGRAFASLANKDVLARAVPKGRRGQVTGRATSIAGMIGLGGAAASLLVTRPDSVSVLVLVVGAASAAFGLAALALLRVTEDAAPAKAKQRASLRSALSDPRLRRFVAVRTLLAASALGGPYIVSLGRDGASTLQTLAAFVLAGGAASFVSAGSWGRFADRSGRGCMAAGGTVAAVAASGVLALQSLAPATTAWAWAGLYFAFSVGYVGVRVGRKTYIVDLAQGDARTQFVASSNTLVALALLALGAGLAVLPSATAAITACTGLTVLGAAGCLALARS
ncbi:MAG: MFS transporter [Nannocystales bacterium]